MSSIAFIADVHLANHRTFAGQSLGGVNQRARLTLAAFEKMLKECERRGVKHLFTLGDLFDSTHPEPQVITALMGIVRKSPVRLHGILGNHERNSYDTGDHAVGPLQQVGMSVVEDFRVVSLDGPKIDVLLVSFNAAQDAAAVLKNALECAAWTKGHERMLGFHFGIRDTATPPWLLKAKDSIDHADLGLLCAEHYVMEVFAGHWHFPLKHHVGDVRIEQLGAFVPNGFRDPGDFYGTVAQVTVEGAATVVECFTVAGPRFFKLSASELGAFCGNPRTPDFLSVTATRAERKDALVQLGVMQDAGAITGFRIEPCRKEAQQAARAGARITRSHVTLEQAVGRFIGAMPLDAGVSRSDVSAVVSGYLKGARA